MAALENGYFEPDDELAGMADAVDAGTATSWQVRVLIADDHMIAREGLRSVLNSCPQIKVVGEASDGNEAVEKAHRLLPDVVLMDYRMPGTDGLEAMRRIKAEHTDVSVIMMSTYDDHAIVEDAVQGGASGYLVKDSSRQLLLYTLLAVASGGILVKASLLNKALGLADGNRTRPALIRQPGKHPPVETLSGREETILRLMAEGMTNKAIADKMGFAEVTVKKHVQVIIAKLYATDRTHAVTIALRLGVIA